MPRVDFTNVPDAVDVLPEGTYVVDVDSIQEKQTREGNEMWSLKLIVNQGEHKGAWVYDNLVFTEKALPRIKMICKAAGVPTNGAFDLQPRHLQGKQVLAEVFNDTYNGKKQAKVRFNGYKNLREMPLPETVGAAALDPTNELPF